MARESPTVNFGATYNVCDFEKSWEGRGYRVLGWWTEGKGASEKLLPKMVYTYVCVCTYVCTYKEIVWATHRRGVYMKKSAHEIRWCRRETGLENVKFSAASELVHEQTIMKVVLDPRRSLKDPCRCIDSEFLAWSSTLQKHFFFYTIFSTNDCIAYKCHQYTGKINARISKVLQKIQSFRHFNSRL